MSSARSPLGFVWRGLYVVLSICHPDFASGSLGEINGFHLYSCGRKDCISITAPKAFAAGVFGSGYGFDQAKLLIRSKQRSQTSEFTSRDLYYDPFSQKIFIRSIEERPHQEAYYDLATEEIRFLKVD